MSEEKCERCGKAKREPGYTVCESCVGASALEQQSRSPHNQDPSGHMRNRGRLSWNNGLKENEYERDRADRQVDLARALQGPGGRFQKQTPADRLESTDENG